MAFDPLTNASSQPAGVRTTKRRGRTSAAQIAALEELGPRWQIRSDDIATGALLVDVGVGDGLATRHWAAEHPEAHVLAVELHRPGIVKLLRMLEADGPPNVRVVEGDALAVLAGLEAGSVGAIRILFPDPWPKRRHLHRRMVDRAFVTTAADLLAPGGELHIATDWDDYAQHIATMVATDPRLVPVHPTSRPSRPITAYEQRGIDAGRRIVDLRYRREGAS